ncbi:FtsX-like permease family protein [Kitasatospora sp. NPDC054939]
MRRSGMQDDRARGRRGLGLLGRVPLRIARRDALRAKGRSALIIAMVALPVLGVAGADVVHRSSRPAPAERVERLMGGADALISAHLPGRAVEQAPFADDGAVVLPQAGGAATPEQRRAADTEPAALVAGLLPPGTVLTAARPGPDVSAGSRAGLLRTGTTEADLTGPLWSGRIVLVGGRAPAAPREIAATRAFLEESGLRLGDTTALKGLEATPFTLTGAVEYPGDLRKVQLVGRPGELLAPLAAALAPAPAPDAGRPGAAAGAAAGDQGPPKDAWLVRLPAGAALDWAKVQEFNRYGYTVTSRNVALDPPARADVPYHRNAHRYDGPDSATTTTVVLATVIGMALLEVALLAGPAFAVGAQRSRRQLALLAAAGGHRGHVRAVVLGSGLVLGTTGAAVGILLGTGLVALLRPWIEEAGGSRFGHFAIVPLDLLAIAGVGIATALLAAVLPAVQAGRRDVVAGLSGRDTVGTPSRWVPVLGLLMVGAGAAGALFGATTQEGGGMPVAGGFSIRTLSVLAGAVTAELGLLLLTPLLLVLCGRLARRLPLAPRLALRDAARHRARTAPAVAAVLAAVAGAVAVGVYTTGSDAQARASYRPLAPVNAVVVNAYVDRDSKLLPQLRGAVEQDLPGLGERADLYEAKYVFCDNCSSTVRVKGGAPSGPSEGGPQGPGGGGGRDDGLRRVGSGGLGQHGDRVVAGDAAVLHNLFGLRGRSAATARAESALAEGRVVVFDPSYLHDGKAVLTMQGGAGAPVRPGEVPQAGTREIGVDAVLVDDPAAARFGAALMSTDAVRKAGLVPDPVGSVWLPDTAPSSKEQQRAEATAVRIVPSASLEVERGYRPKSDVASLSLSGFAAVVVLGAAAVATGLAAADSRNDRTTLAAIGAAPWTRRLQAGLQCTLIASIGAVLGTVSGFVPALALLRSRASGQPGAEAPFAAPWTLIVLITVVLPVVAGLGAALFTRSGGRPARRGAA